MAEKPTKNGLRSESVSDLFNVEFPARNAVARDLKPPRVPELTDQLIDLGSVATAARTLDVEHSALSPGSDRIGNHGVRRTLTLEVSCRTPVFPRDAILLPKNPALFVNQRTHPPDLV